jgi:hypothetical protein
MCFKSFHIPTPNSWSTIIAIRQRGTEYLQAVATVAFGTLHKVTNNEPSVNTL